MICSKNDLLIGLTVVNAVLFIGSLLTPDMVSGVVSWTIWILTFVESGSWLFLMALANGWVTGTESNKRRYEK